MTNRNPIPDDAMLVAINFAKHKNAVLFKRPGSSRRRSLTIINDRSEHDRLIVELTGYGREVVCGFWATGNYRRPLGWRLMRLASMSGWCHHWHSPAPGRRCMAAGKRMIY